jgi:hypothetical protein
MVAQAQESEALPPVTYDNLMHMVQDNATLSKLLCA